MLVLHRRGLTPSSLQQYVVEWIKEGDNTLVIRTSIEPCGYYKVYDLGQVFDSKCKASLTGRRIDPGKGGFLRHPPLLGSDL